MGFSGFPSNVVLGGRMFNGRGRKSWKREGEEAEEPRCRLLFARAHPCRSSSPMTGSSEIHENHAGGRERKSWFAKACLRWSSLPMPGSSETHAWVSRVGLSRLLRGFGETHGVGFAKPRHGCFSLFLCGLICYFCLILIFCNW